MIGLGLGLGEVQSVVGGSGPGPSDLSNLIVHISADGSFTTAEESHTPGTPYHCTGAQTIVNLADGGPTLTFHGSTNATRPYYHTADWTLNVGVDETLPRPNSYPFIATNKPSDNTLVTCTEYRMAFSGATADQTDYAGISIVYAESRQIGRRIWENIGGGGSYGRIDWSEDAYLALWDSGASGTVAVGTADETRGFWHVITWSHTAAAGTSFAINGVRQGTNAALDNAMRFNCFAPYTQYTTAFVDHVLYAAGHTLADMDAVASAMASKYGITYTTP